jgi:hypothetical protein
MTYWEIRYREQTPGISGFSVKAIPKESRWEGYVSGVGTRLFPSFEVARAWGQEAGAFADESKRIARLEGGSA